MPTLREPVQSKRTSTFHIRATLSKETSELRTIVMASHHRGNHIIMSTIIMSNTSLWQQHHHQAVEKCKRSGTREFRFRLENTLGRKTLCFFRSSGCRGRRRRVSVSAVAHDLGKLPTKSAQDCSEGAIST